ncbi:hypothetical protein GX51_04580 [Blastomyces parvus]|uniref:Uncharacterized protein n=1 Tax=Blastomyces parvus TaxID=2060905 RepID=A0A2B7X192_9EURO|nr:hypothetical protein GX51_04580 [Blastomyces parvus]
MVFFVDWALWLKLCFFLVLVYGTGVHIYNSLQLKRLSAAAAAEAATVRTPKMLEAGSDEIPFGSRAIERGIEVEGIWISNQNTPAGSPIWGPTPDPSRPASLGSKSTLNFHPPLPSKGGSGYLSPKTATLGRCKPTSVSSPLPYPGFHDHANASSSGTNGRRAKSEFVPRNEQESEPEPHIPQSDNGYSEFEFGELGGVDSSDQQQESGYSSMNSRVAEDGSVLEPQESSFITPIATASEGNLHLHGCSAEFESGSRVLNCVSGNGQLRSASGPPYEQAHLNPMENCRIVDDQEHGDLLPLHSRRRFSIAETGQFGNGRSGCVEVDDRNDDANEHAHVITAQFGGLPAAQAV